MSSLRSAAETEHPSENVLELIAYAVAAECCEQAGRPRREERFGNVQAPTDSLDHESYRRVEYDDAIKQHLDSLDDVLLHGDIGTGKTTTALSQATSWEEAYGALIWLDLTDPNDCDESVAHALLTAERRARTLVVVDNVQANVTDAVGVFKLVSRMRTDLGLPMVVLATGSSAVAKVITPSRYFINPVPVPTNGHEVVDAILRGAEELSRANEAQIRDLAGGNAFVARMAIDLLEVHLRVPVAHEFADLAAEQLGADKVEPAARLLLYKLACLSLVEIEAHQRCTMLARERPALDQLRRAGLVHLNDESYSVGHRSLAKVLVRHGYRAWGSKDRPLPSPDRVIYDFLQRADKAQIKATLDGLDLLPVDSGSPPTGSKRLAGAWRAFGSLGDWLVRRTETDPTWGDEVTSAAFAGVALVNHDRPDAWRKTAKFVRDRISYSTDALPLWEGSASADLAAFQALHDLLLKEQQVLRDQLNGSELAEQLFDSETACRAWLLGVLLCFEAKAVDDQYERERIDRLHRIAATMVDGGVHEDLPPWIAAQIALGLREAGYTYKSDHVLHKVCDWLYTPVYDGGPYQAGAGWSKGPRWDVFDPLASALCVSALLHADAPKNDKLETGYQSLCNAQPGLKDSGQETELALIVEARLRTGDEWEDLHSAILELLGWAARERSGLGEKATGPGDPFSASAKGPFIAVRMNTIIWTAVMKELRRLLRELWKLDDLLLVSDSVPLPDDSPDPLDSPQDERPPARPTPRLLAEVHRGIERLRRRIDKRIEEAAELLQGMVDRRSVQEPVRRQLNLWQGHHAELEAIEAEVNQGTVTEEILNRLNALGRAVFGPGWREISIEE
jgi:hypothetical protein